MNTEIADLNIEEIAFVNGSGQIDQLASPASATSVYPEIENNPP